MAINSIGIIGGGVSGLATAYELRRNAIANNQSLEIHIFEQHPLIGGNADTVVVNLGNWKKAKQPSASYHRWADMGVNDINLTTYKRIVKIMKEINYFDANKLEANPKLLPLENTESYFTWDSDILLTDDNDLEHGVSDPQFSIAEKDNKEFSFWVKVIYSAADTIVGDDENLNLDITIGGFFTAVIANPKKELEEFVDKAIDWDNPAIKRMLTEIRDNIFYARTSAMYFANDYGPEEMCLAAPMCYYRRQENKADTTEPDRRYFVGGSTRWLKALLDNLCDAKKGNDLVTIERHLDYSARANVSTEKITISNNNDPTEQYTVDRCVVTVHADDAAGLLEFDYPEVSEPSVTKQLNKDNAALLQILHSISYTSSVAICHTYSGILPSNRNQWRSYNILIRKGCSLKPYSMTYLCNRHQNDAGSAQSERYNYNQVGLPQFFITLNPQREIPERYILNCVDSKEVSDELRAELPQLSNNNENSNDNNIRYGRIATGKPAISYFKHNLINKKCFIAQKSLQQYHQSAGNLFFAGGWSLGSGLHEECWKQAERVAQLICPV